MKILLLAGEESGLIYARGIRSRLVDHEVRGYQDYGFATADLAVMGFGAVIRRLPFFIGVKRTMERAIDEWKPDVVCTVDYPGLNLKLAAYAKARGIRTIHVVCPQVWAWKQGRIPKIEAAIDCLCCFFPFEPQLFSPGFATFVGHPLVNDFAADAASHPVAPRPSGEKLVALLPGSRRGEIERILPTLLASVPLMKGARFVIPAANEKAFDLISSIVGSAGCAAAVEIRLGGARQLLRTADCAAVASGTATLEAALADCPTVLVYRVSAALAAFARRVIRGTKYIGLANVIWDRCVRRDGAADADEPPMPELLQEAFTPSAVAEHLNRWLSDADERSAAVRRLGATVAALKAQGDPLSAIVRKIDDSRDKCPLQSNSDSTII